MQFTVGKTKYDNKVEGSKSKDNKDPKNKKKDMTGASNTGSIGGAQKAVKIRTQNSPDKVSKPQGTEIDVTNYTRGKHDGDSGVKMQEKRQKTIIRKNALYSDGAIAAAKRSRGL